MINDEVIARSGVIPNSVSSAASGGGGAETGRSLPPSQREPLTMPTPSPSASPTDSPLPRIDPATGAPIAGGGVAPNQVIDPKTGRPIDTPANAGQPVDPRVTAPAATGDTPSGAPGGEAAAGGAGAAGENEEDVQLPPTTVQPAVLRTVRRPENVERAIAKARAEAERRRQEERKRPKKEDVITPEMMAMLTPKPAPPLPMVINTGSTIGLMLEVSPRSINAQLGNPVKLDIEADGKRPSNLGKMSIKFDSSKLKVVGVKGGDLLNSPLPIEHKIVDGQIVVQFNSPVGIKAGKGKLLTIEFSSIEQGQSEISIDTKQSQISDDKNRAFQWKATGSRVAVFK